MISCWFTTWSPAAEPAILVPQEAGTRWIWVPETCGDVETVTRCNLRSRPLHLRRKIILYSGWLVNGYDTFYLFQPPFPDLRSPRFLLFIGTWIFDAKPDWMFDCCWDVTSCGEGSGLSSCSPLSDSGCLAISSEAELLRTWVSPPSGGSLWIKTLSTIWTYSNRCAKECKEKKCSKSDQWILKSSFST